MAPQITAPVADFEGRVVGVPFTKGVGETDDPAALAYFTRQGYTIGEASDTGKTETGKGDGGGDDLDALQAADLKKLAKELGVSGSGKKPEIAARIREARAAAAKSEPKGDDETGKTNDDNSTEAGETETTPAETVAGSSEHGSVREIEE